MPVPTSRAHIQLVRETSKLVACRSEKPLKLLSPQVHPDVVCLVQSSYGGGIVQGDEIRLELQVDAGATLFLTTQANSRAFRTEPGNTAHQHLEATLEENAVAVVYPDPLVMHADSHFAQQQHWHLAASSTLVLLDWFQCGRSDSGEAFAYRALDAVVEIDRNGNPLVVDPFHSDPTDQDPRNPARFGPMHLLLNLYLVGPRIAPLIEALQPLIDHPENHQLRELTDSPSPPERSWLSSLSQVEDDVVLVRAAATTRQALRPLLDALFTACAAPELLGFNAQDRKP